MYHHPFMILYNPLPPFFIWGYFHHHPKIKGVFVGIVLKSKGYIWKMMKNNDNLNEKID